jgi:hypothetical protein
VGFFRPTANFQKAPKYQEVLHDSLAALPMVTAKFLPKRIRRCKKLNKIQN